jgi:catechol 2,3-dioxygenase-like lactoylglutathione lyase family enzyme
MPTNPRFAFALDYVKDVEVAKRFYVDVLGLEVERNHPTFVQFDRFAIASDESLGGKGESELYWVVDDAEIAFGDLSKRAEVVLPLQQKPFGKVFAVKDPDGRPRYVVEFAKSRPSTTR